MQNAPTEELDKLIDTFSTAMLVTTSLTGQPRARPMAIAHHRAGGALYFATRAEDEKLREILQAPIVAVTMQGDECYLSITGQARLETDRVLADKLWSPSMGLWFPEGAGDSQLTLIHLEPSYAEYWDRQGLRGLEFIWEAGRAVLRGEKARDENLGRHAKVHLKRDASAGQQD